MELIDLANSVNSSFSKTVFLRWLIFLLGSDCDFTAQLFWNYFFWHQYLFYRGFPSMWNVVISLCCCLSFNWVSLKTQKKMPLFNPQLVDILILIGGVICFTVVSLQWAMLLSDHFVISVSTEFPSNSKEGAPFHPTACGYSRAYQGSHRGHLRDSSQEDIFKLCASTAGTEFFVWAYLKNQVKSYSSPWFSAFLCCCHSS